MDSIFFMDLDMDLDWKFQMDLDMDMDFFPNGFGLGFRFLFHLGLDWILDLKNCSDLDLDLDFISQMDSNPSPRIQIRTVTSYYAVPLFL